MYIFGLIALLIGFGAGYAVRSVIFRPKFYGYINVTSDEAGPKLFQLELDGMPEQLVEHKTVSFVVRSN